MKRIALAALLVPTLVGIARAGELEKAFADLKALVSAQAEDPAKARQKLLDEKLLSAVSGANVAEIKRLVAMGANPNAYNGFHSTPLSTAVFYHGDVAVMQALLDLGAQVDFKGTCDYTALHEAAREGRIEAAKFLVAHRATVDAKACLGDTPLNEAAANGKTEVFKYLLGLGADPNLAGYEGKTPIYHAANAFVMPKDNEILNALLADKRVNVNAETEDGTTPLKLAVKAKHLDLVKVLLAVPGVDVNNNAGGTSALFIAELNNYEEIAALLRAAGARLVAAR